jgi:pimeloyl-ACP methyl ester carboxylesterase
MARNHHTNHRLAAVGLTLAVLASGAACSGDDEPAKANASSNAEDAADTPTSTTPPEQFTGSIDDFYQVPDPLPEGVPGQLIRVQDVSTTDIQTTVRVMYHSRDAEDRDRAVTGIITYPTAAAPEGGWPVVSWSHGTAGIAPKCAPSRLGGEAPAFDVEGVAVATDYIGLGPVGELHPYLSKFAEGNAAIDAVRAAQNLPAAHASATWLSIGHSQGGHAALAAAELSADYAPELDLIGTVAFAPGSDFTKHFGGIDDIVARVTGAMALYGSVSEHPDIDPADYVGPELAAKADVIENECLDAIIPALAVLPADTYYAHPPEDTEPAKSFLIANDVGDVKVDAPLLLVSGTDDQTVVIDRVRSLYSRLCDAGQVTELVVVEGATHDIIPPSITQAEAWIKARLDDQPATNSCEAAAG